jgi:MoaA/NifB/PqqE/SkfB family radical SAM enzyme
MSNTLCSYVFAHTDIEPNGDIKFCCAAVAGTNRDPNGNVYNITTHTLKEAWNSEILKQTRMEMIAGKRPEVCNYCWQLENPDNTQGSSVRLQSAEIRIPISSVTDRIEYAKNHNGELKDLAFDFQLSIGNLCNLACKMCNPGYSTQYQKFFSKFHNSPQEINFVKNPPLKGSKHFEFSFGTNFDWPVTQSLSEIFKDHTATLKTIFFTGGEPTLIPEVLEFIDYLSINAPRDFTVWPSTNCTNINKRMLESLGQFNEIWLNLSLDGMDDIAYIQRTPSKWENIEKNVDQLMYWVKDQRNNGKEVAVGVISTLTSLNFHHILDFWEYLDNRYGQITQYGISANVVLLKNTNFGIETVPKVVIEELRNKCIQLLEKSNESTRVALEQYLHLLNTVNFADNHEQIHFCLEKLQQYHPDLDIKKIYHIYYTDQLT